MKKKSRQNQGSWLVALIAACMLIIVAGGFWYIKFVRDNLREQSIQTVMTVTRQQEQAFDTFVSGDRERLHSFAEYLSENSLAEEEIQRLLMLFNETDAIYSVVCPNEGWFCSNSSSEIRQLDKDAASVYHDLEGAGVRESFLGQFSGNLRFGYYETFTFPDGQKGLVQKSYDRTKVSETFSLSFYDDQGLSHVVNRDGDIMLRPSSITENLYNNIFDSLSDRTGQQEQIDLFIEALRNGEEGTMAFADENRELIYTYVPMTAVDGWYLVSVLPSSAIRVEADRIMRSSQTAAIFLAVILVICIVFAFLILRTQKDMQSKDQEIDRQTQLFNIFSTYLSRNTNDVYLMLDPGYCHIDYASPNLERVFGVSAQDLLNNLEGVEAVSASGEPVNFKALCGLEPETGVESISTVWKNPKTHEDEWFRLGAYCTQVQGRNKLVAYISDRTKEHRDRSALVDALQMAKAASEAKTSFLSSVSHDIRTPMNAIIGFLSLMRSEVDNRAVMLEYIDRVDAASQHLLGLINDVLDMSKIESGSTTLSIFDMDLAEVIDEINTIIRPQTKARGQTFDIFVASLEHEHLKADKLRLNQILINLLSNAVKYTPEGGNIQLRVEERPQVVSNYSRIRFTVSDNGLGMSEEYQKQIFDPFTREESKVIHEIQGTGLGMPITKSLVDLMGGTIEVESRLGEGSTFTVELELHIQEREDDPKFWAAHGVTRMIVADDDENVCQGIVKIMSKTGVVVEYATDGESAIQMMRTSREAGRPYDLILLDWKMPNLNGLETARLIRQEYSNKVPIVLLTAYDWSDIEQEAMEIGVSHFLPKPFFMSNFKEAIRRCMGVLKTEGEAEDDIVRGKNILVVDDIEVNRIILVKILTTLGAQCNVAGNGREALEAFEQSQSGEYDLILMDVQMPVMDGYAATRAIRSSGHPSAGTVPIIAMTANAFVDDVREAIDSGMDAHVAKPVQMDKLKATIRQVLDSRKGQETNTFLST